MKNQEPLTKVLNDPDVLRRINELTQEPGTNRNKVVKTLCQELDLRSATGDLRTTACSYALRALDQAGKIALPKPRFAVRRAASRRPSAPAPLPQGLPGFAGQVRGLRLELADTPARSEMWNELIIAEHPLKSARMGGRQLRYLIASDHGYLGAAGIGAAARHLSARDKWIGWNKELRERNVNGIAGLCRFLIRPGVRCANLASRVLGMMRRRVARDFEARYGERPWLMETFVDAAQFRGTCFKAAGWIRIGQTAGRGRYDRHNKRDKPVKDIYVFPLDPGFRRKLGTRAPEAPGPLAPEEGLDTDSWAANEFAGAPLGDARLVKRLIRMAHLKALRPAAAGPGARGSDAKQHYYFMELADDSPVALETILAPHARRTERRAAGGGDILLISDATDISYSSLRTCRGLGALGTNQTKAVGKGLRLQTQLAATASGVPLGIAWAKGWAPVIREKGEKKKDYSKIPIEQKETYVWVLALRNAARVARERSGQRIISVFDRGADAFEVLAEHQRDPAADLIVRVKYNRAVSEGGRLFDAARAFPEAGRAQIRIPRQSGRPKHNRSAPRKARAARDAQLIVRYGSVTVNPPNHLQDKYPEPVRLGVVYAVEADAPADGGPRVEWLLYTSLPLACLEDALLVLRYYCLRWRIEDWHKVLKSGCRIEDLQHESAARLWRGIAIAMVVAWRIMLLTLLGREVPGLPADVLFTEDEMFILTLLQKKTPGSLAR